VYFNATELSGTMNITYSNVRDSVGGEGNINLQPAFAGTGCTTDDLRIVAGSPAIDAGNPDPQFNDVCFPPSLGTVRNDMGAFGGPGACPWVL
jgi:hypothetical protein